MGKDQSLVPWPLILASTSKYRAQLLSHLGWSFTTENPGVNEDVLKDGTRAPEDLAMELSRLKARAVFARHQDSCVIGSDQVCSVDGMILGKPHTEENAILQLLSMQGKAHRLLTAVTVINPDFETSFLNITTLHMRDLSREEITRYVCSDLPLDCAGSYKLESKGIRLFERIEMSDHTAIIGLPLIELANVLVDQGYPL